MTAAAANKKILAAVPKNGNAGISAIAKKAGVAIPVARVHLGALEVVGSVKRSGVKTTGKRGRPAYLYTRVA